jgi:hypothetical protein
MNRLTIVLMTVAVLTVFLLQAGAGGLAAQTAPDATIFLEPFASDGETAATTIQIDGGHFWVAVGIHAFERTTIMVKIPYQPIGRWPNQSYRFVDTYESEGVNGEWSGPQSGYFVFTGEVRPYSGEGPDIVGLELEAVLDSINEFVIIVEADEREYVADPVTVIIGQPPTYNLFLPLIVKDN